MKQKLEILEEKLEKKISGEEITVTMKMTEWNRLQSKTESANPEQPVFNPHHFPYYPQMFYGAVPKKN